MCGILLRPHRSLSNHEKLYWIVLRIDLSLASFKPAKQVRVGKILKCWIVECYSPKDYKYLSKYEGIISNFRLCRTQLNFFSSFFSTFFFFFNPHGLALIVWGLFKRFWLNIFRREFTIGLRNFTRFDADSSRLCIWLFAFSFALEVIQKLKCELFLFFEFHYFIFHFLAENRILLQPVSQLSMKQQCWKH